MQNAFAKNAQESVRIRSCLETVTLRLGNWFGEDVLRGRRAGTSRGDDGPTAHEGGDRETARRSSEVRDRDQVAEPLMIQREQEGQMQTEKEKMLAGELYDPLDPTLVQARERARDLCQNLNVTRE